MESDPRIQDLWLQLLKKKLRPGAVATEKVAEGYFLVALRADGGASPGVKSTFPDYQALGSKIPNRNRTRAVYLDSGSTYNLSGVEGLREWAGDLAAEVEGGARHAFAVVDIETLGKGIAAGLTAEGWKVERAGPDLNVSDGRFTEPVNLLRVAVRMVLSRSNVNEAARVVAREVGRQLARDAQFFRCFRSRFAEYGVGVVDHFYVA